MKMRKLGHSRMRSRIVLLRMKVNQRRRIRRLRRIRVRR